MWDLFWNNTVCHYYSQSEILQFIMVSLFMAAHAYCDAAMVTIFQAPSIYTRRHKYLLILLRLTSSITWERVKSWIIACWIVVNGLRTKMTVWLIAGVSGEKIWRTKWEPDILSAQIWLYQIKKIISYGSAWMNWKVFSVEHYDQRKIYFKSHSSTQ